MNIVRFLRMSVHLQMMPVLESGEETLVGGQAVTGTVLLNHIVLWWFWRWLVLAGVNVYLANTLCRWR